MAYITIAIMWLTVADGPEPEQSLLPSLQHATDRRFPEKSPAEKQELYEHIASRLITMADNLPRYSTGE